MTAKPVEERIREHYQVANGEWLVPKSHIKEARLLKEAAERIDQLKGYESKYWAETLRRDEKVEARRRELDEREQKIAAREHKFETRLKEAKDTLRFLDYM
jgi:hypothetical protein